MTSKDISRRAFVGDLAATGLAFTIVPRHVLGRGYLAPSDMLNVASIGVGGKGESDVQGMADAGANIYALCDVDWNSAETSFRHFPQAKRFRDYREMLDHEGKNIDAVTVTTPDHVHAAATMAALKLGKPVFCQKPLARTLYEVRTVMDQARRSKLPTQMGNQGHTGEGTRLVREAYEAGMIGTIREVHYWTNRPIWPQAIDRPTEAHNVPPYLDWNLWLGPAPERPYNPAYAPFRWRGWWDFGTGALGDIACHAMDAAFWTFDLRYPTRIEPESSQLFKETAPKSSRVTYQFPAVGSRPEVKVVWRDGGLWPARPIGLSDDVDWPYGDVGGQLWIGDEGMLLADCYGDGARLLTKSGTTLLSAHPPAQKYPRSPGVYKEWIGAIKGGPAPNSSFDGHAGPLTQMVIFGCVAVRMGRTIEVDPATGNITTPGVPEEYIKPVFRKGWTL